MSFFSLGFVCLPLSLQGASVVFEPSLYFSEQDSPFYEGIQNGTIYLEDFEDQALNTPFVSVTPSLLTFGTTGRALNPNVSDGNIRGVDGDDGLIDGLTFAGDSWFTAFRFGGGADDRHSFDFTPDAQGRYPTYVGLVVTEVDEFGNTVDIGALGLDGLPIGALLEQFDPNEWTVPVDTPIGSPLRQRFIGLHSTEGISRLFISNARQVDHLQYGYSIPEPSIAVFLLAGLGLLRHRRRKSSTSE